MGNIPYESLEELYLELAQIRERCIATRRVTEPQNQFPYQNTQIRIDGLLDWLGSRVSPD